MFDKYTIFPTNIWKTHIDPSEFNKDELVSIMYENYRRDPYRNAWTNDGTLHHCYNDWENPKFIKPNLASLMDVYFKVIGQFVNHISPLMNKIPKYNYILANLTANKEGQYMGEHDHLSVDQHCGCVYSAVHYIKLENHQPSTTFFNPVIAGQHYTTYEYATKHFNASNQENSTNYASWEIPTAENDLVIFPSYLKHKVRGNWRQLSPDELRITSVVNINFFHD
jgi:hypothetical protein